MKLQWVIDFYGPVKSSWTSTRLMDLRQDDDSSIYRSLWLNDYIRLVINGYELKSRSHFMSPHPSGTARVAGGGPAGRNVELSINGTSPIARWLISWEVLVKWMVSIGTQLCEQFAIESHHL